MPTDQKLFKFDKDDKELLDDAFKALDVFNEHGWDKGQEFLDEAKQKKERRNYLRTREQQTEQIFVYKNMETLKKTKIDCKISKSACFVPLFSTFRSFMRVMRQSM